MASSAHIFAARDYPVLKFERHTYEVDKGESLLIILLPLIVPLTKTQKISPAWM